MATAFHSAYLESLTPFWPSHFSDAADRRTRTQIAATKKIAPELLAVLSEQNPGANLAGLGQGRTALVVTGQQIGLFLGPLYTVYKAATAIALARRLSDESGVACQALFWLQTEDHDFAEIASASFIDARGRVASVKLGDDAALARASVAERVLGDEITALNQSLVENLGAHGAEVAALLAKHYRPGARLADAFAGVLSEFFRNEGLLVFNPRDARVAALAKDFWRKSLAETDAIEATLSIRDQALEQAGFAQQIKLRAGSPLVFFHRDGENRSRYRLQRCAAGFAVIGHDETIALPALLALCNEAPLRFSTSALLRPLLQDTLLPTAAYVGGAAELDYFAQIEPLYAHFSLLPPLLFHRARFRLWPAPATRLLEQLGLTPSDAAKPFDELFTRLAPPARDLPSEEWKALDARLAEFAAGAPKDLQKTALRAQRSVAGAIARLQRRSTHANDANEESIASRLQRLLAWAQPNALPQERVLGFAPFAARAGLADFRAAIFAALDPFDATLKDLRL